MDPITEPLIKKHEIIMKGICIGCGVKHHGGTGLEIYRDLSDSDKTKIKKEIFKCQDCGDIINYKDIQQNVWQHNKLQEQKIIKGKKIDV